MPDDLRAQLIAAYENRVATAPPPRPPRSPYLPEYQRPERRTRPTYADPTGNTAIGNINKEKKQ